MFFVLRPAVSVYSSLTSKNLAAPLEILIGNFGILQLYKQTKKKKQTYIHTYMHTYIHTYIHTYVYIRARKRAHTHTNTHTLTHSLTHTHTHTHKHTLSLSHTHTHTHTLCVHLYYLHSLEAWRFLCQSVNKLLVSYPSVYRKYPDTSSSVYCKDIGTLIFRPQLLILTCLLFLSTIHSERLIYKFSCDTVLLQS